MIYAIDSRTVNIPEDTVFFALKGRMNDGHDYIKSLYSKGVREFVVSRHLPEFKNMPDATFHYVDNVLDELQNMAGKRRNEFHGEVVGITGSNGKTVVKEWIAQLMEQDIPLYRSPRSYNSQIGVPLSILGIDDNIEIALIEAGMSRKGEMKRLQKIIRPDVGIFTHFGDAHSENFKDDEERLE